MNKRTAAKVESYQKNLKKIQSLFEWNLQDLGIKIRQEWVLPVCQAHGLEYMAGNGEFYFQKGDLIIYPYYFDALGEVWVDSNTPKEKALALKADLGPIFKILNLETEYNQYLGYYVPEVRKDDLR